MKCVKKAFRGYTTSRTEAFEWYLSFICDQHSVEGFERSGQPPSSRTEEDVQKVRQCPSIRRVDARVTMFVTSYACHRVGADAL
jgi:hypothetical protein